MKNFVKKLDTSSELLIQRYKNGIRLIRPDQYAKNNYFLLGAIEKFLELPFNVYFLNCDSIIQNMNEITAETMQFQSISNAIGKSMLHVAERRSAQSIINGDIQVLTNQSMKFFDHKFDFKNGKICHGLSIKYPWYDHNCRLIGVFGISVIFGLQPLADSLTYIAQLGLLNSTQIKYHASDYITPLPFKNINLSRQENLCLKYLMQGKSAKAIANILSLSKRTVEHYIENIKNKMGVSSKYELMLKIMNHQ